METFKKIRKIVFIGLALGFLIFIVYQFHQLKVVNSKNPAIILYTTPKDYMNLFNDSAKKELNLDITYSFKLKNPISKFSYNKFYSLIITKIDTINNLPLDKSVNEQYNQGNETINGYYFSFDQKGVTTNYNMMSFEKVEGIYVSLQGEGIKSIVKNDSVVNYFLNAHKFSIRYSQSGAIEIYGEAKTTTFAPNNNKIPISLMFLKKNHCLYFLSLTANNPAGKFDSSLLCKLMR